MITSDTSSTSFISVPVLSLASALNSTSKPAFLTSLRSALLNVGFLYLSDTGIPPTLFDEVKTQCRNFFEELDEEDKLSIEMKREKSFLGYSRLGMETTAGAADQREQLDLSTSHPLPTPDEPVWHNLRAPNQWPPASKIPAFRPVYEEYMSRMADISMKFTSLVAEALGMPPTAFDAFFDADQQHKLKLVRYPDVATNDRAGQGVGPHKDSMLSSYLLQVSPHAGLQAQNTAGDWIDVKPIDGTVVVVIGQGLEAITGGVCASTTHRVLSPKAGLGPRYSVPFFQGVAADVNFEPLDIPADARAERQQVLKRNGARLDDVEFTFVRERWRTLGEATFMNRIKSHQDVGERWYPEVLAQVLAQEAEDTKSKREKAEKGNNNMAPTDSINSDRLPQAVPAH